MFRCRHCGVRASSVQELVEPSAPTAETLEAQLVDVRQQQAAQAAAIERVAQAVDELGAQFLGQVAQNEKPMQDRVLTDDQVKRLQKQAEALVDPPRC